MKGFFAAIFAALIVVLGSAAMAQHYCGGIAAISSATPTPPAGNFPQFNSNGAITTTYNASTSLWLRDILAMSPQTHSPPGCTTAPCTDITSSGINVFEDGTAYPYPASPSTGNPPYGCAAGAGFTTCAETGWTNNEFATYKNRFNSIGIPYVVTTDNTVDGTSASFQGSFPTTAAWMKYITDHLKSQDSLQNIFVNAISRDEFSLYFAPCSVGNILDGFGIGFAGDPNAQVTQSNGTVGACPSFTPNAGGAFTTAAFSHIPWGAEPFSGKLQDWWTLNYTGGATSPSLASDFVAYESTCGGTNCATLSTNTSGMLTAFKGPDQYWRTTVSNARPGLPMFAMGQNDGVFYTAQHTGAPFNYVNGTDTLQQGSVGPGVIVDQVFYAVAHGWSGIRFYKYDRDSFCQSRTNPVIGTEYQTGTSPVSDWNNFGCAGQDRWFAMAAAFNLVKTVEPYVLQPATTAPNSPTNCDSDGSTALSIVCGAKSGNNGHLVIVINWSDSTQSFTFNPTSPTNYVNGATTTNMWEIVGGNDPTCGAQKSAYAATANALTNPTRTSPPYDCYRGETNVNGNVLAITALPGAALAAPTSGSCGGLASGQPLGRNGSFSGGACTWTMPALAAYVFLYHS